MFSQYRTKVLRIIISIDKFAPVKIKRTDELNPENIQGVRDIGWQNN